jgi:hypothetical protein
MFYITEWSRDKVLFNDNINFWGRRSVCLANLFFSISGSNTVQQRTMIAGSSMSLHTNKEWKALPPLGPYYGKTWYIEREGEGAFDPVINRTPAQAAAARLMPKPPNLETYAAALSRDQMDKTVVLEYGQFMPTDIQRADWIEAMIKDHKLAKHTVNALMMCPSLKSHCPRCREIHDHRHRNFSPFRRFVTWTTREGTRACCHC